MNRSQGFTLVELMIVVAIIGVLAAVAIPSFREYQLTSKRTEAYANLAALAKAQKSYFAEYNNFVAVDSEPAGATGKPPTSTTRSKDSIVTQFATVGWAPDGDVFYDYDTATPDNTGMGTCTCTEACFTASAYGDLDGDGLFSVMVFAHPDVTGNYCESALLGFGPPLNASGDRMFDEVARQTITDDF
jgi:prepilin-type N-terminal cleavage/methylation domain-containing protein